MANEEVLGSRKTMFVLVIVVGCFAVLWPRILGPLLLGPAARPAQFDRDAGCCEVIFESEVAVLELVNEVCSSAVGSDGKMSPFAANECRKTVNETCGLDIAAFLKRSDNVGKSTKALLQTMKQSNSSCLKEHFGVPIWSIGVHTALNSWTQQDTMKQERSPIRAGPHPALRERGRAIPVNAPTPPSRAAVSMPPHARPPPIPGMRPPLGSPGGPVPAPKSSMGFVMPIYTICIIVFFVYTLSKILFKRTGSIPYEQVSPDPHFRRRVFRDDSRSSPETKLVVTAISGLVAEVHQQMEANYAQSQQRQEAENHSRTYTNGSVLKSSPNIVASEFVEQKEKSPEPEKPKDASPEPEKPSEKLPSPELSPEKEPEPELSPEKESDSSPDKEPESSPEKDPEPTPERSSPEKELSPEESPERETTPDNVESNPHQSGSIEDDLLKLTEDIKEKKENLARSTEEFLNDAKESLNEAEDEAWKDEEEFSNEAEDKALKDEEELLNEASDNALKDEEEFLNEATNKALKDEEFLNEAEAEALRNEEEVLNDMKESLNEAKEFMNEAKEETVKLLKEALKEDSVEEEEDEDEPEPDVSVKHEADEVTSIFLETRIPQQSRVLVAEFEDKTKPAPRRHDPMVVSGKMTLSLIQDAPRDTPENDPESTVTDFTTASAMTQPVAEKDGESSGEEIEEEIEIEEIEEEEEEKKQEAKE